MPQRKALLLPDSIKQWEKQVKIIYLRFPPPPSAVRRYLLSISTSRHDGPYLPRALTNRRAFPG